MVAICGHVNAQTYKKTTLDFNADGLTFAKGGGYQETVGADGNIEANCSGLSLKSLSLGDRDLALKSTAVTTKCMIETKDYGDLRLSINSGNYSYSILVTSQQEIVFKKLASATSPATKPH